MGCLLLCVYVYVHVSIGLVFTPSVFAVGTLLCIARLRGAALQCSRWYTRDTHLIASLGLNLGVTCTAIYAALFDRESIAIAVALGSYLCLKIARLCTLECVHAIVCVCVCVCVCVLVCADAL